MTDLLTIYDVLRLPSGAQLVSDRGEVTLLVMSHDGPNKLTLARVPLEQFFSLLEQRGIHRTTDDAVLLQQAGRGEVAKRQTPVAQQIPDQDRASTSRTNLEQRGLLRGEQTSAAPLEGVPGRVQEPDPEVPPRPAVGRRGSEPACPETAPPSASADAAPHKQDHGHHPEPEDRGHATTKHGDLGDALPQAAVTPSPHSQARGAEHEPIHAPLKRSGPAKGYTFDKTPCPTCGKLIARNQLVNHAKRGCGREPVPTTTTCMDCGTAVTKSNLTRHRKVCDRRPVKVAREATPVASEPEPDPKPVAVPSIGAPVPTPDLPEMLRCGLCFDPTPVLLFVHGHELCAACAARNPAPRWDGKWPSHGV